MNQMTDTEKVIADKLWNMDGVDEYYDRMFRDKAWKEQVEIINKCAEPLKEYLLLKQRNPIGQIIVREPVVGKNRNKDVYHDIRTFEAFVKYKNRKQ